MTDAPENLLVTLLFAVLLALVGSGWVVVRRMLDTRLEAHALRVQAEALLARGSREVEEQLTAWGMTPAEIEVAQLLLRGLGYGQIAQVRDTTEQATRQQARSIYAKAGVTSRAELAAWFVGVGS